MLTMDIHDVGLLGICLEILFSNSCQSAQVFFFFLLLFAQDDEDRFQRLAEIYFILLKYGALPPMEAMEASVSFKITNIFAEILL